MTALFTLFQLGPLTLKNRIIMAPLTRSRSQQPGNIPTRMNALYYAQRAGAGLIISEATQISQQGQGYAWTPGIHTPEQVAGWQLVTAAVHEAGGLIFAQLWHVGRVSHPALQPDGQLPVAPSAIAPGGLAFIADESGAPQLVPFVPPRALAIEEMPYLVQQYVHGAKNAQAAGFDGVEVHAANGYLLDQFLNSSTNQREDAYGGPVENRARLLLEVVEAVCGVWGAGRVGVRLSPLGTFNDMGDADPEALFGHVAERLNAFELAYLHVVEPVIAGNATTETPDPRAGAVLKRIRENYRGTLIVCGGYDAAKAGAALGGGRADLIAFGRAFLANPDLPERLRVGAALNLPDPNTFYGGGPQGYLDYPTLAQQRGEQPMPDCGGFEPA
ncbi:alkene reductase [Methylomagnum ishizawai]|uniref:alkene reductase n=1 Tax=Methylomagnum ishizawai TaxID=1760988 RepID=UPI001C3424E0|nr:alkene reductase [Methylomagnum ishizawai]BBL73566.1 alkene reductase [Methylomagnum ishizawai]